MNVCGVACSFAKTRSASFSAATPNDLHGCPKRRVHHHACRALDKDGNGMLEADEVCAYRMKARWRAGGPRRDGTLPMTCYLWRAPCDDSNLALARLFAPAHARPVRPPPLPPPAPAHPTPLRSQPPAHRPTNCNAHRPICPQPLTQCTNTHAQYPLAACGWCGGAPEG